DIQGGELAVFKNGVNQLAQAVVVQAEVSFVPLYVNQPSIGHIDLEMRKQGFIPHCFASMDKRPIAPCMVNNDPHQAVNQLLEADIVYVRDFSHPELLSDEQLKQMALIVQQCYGSFDLAMRCVMILEQRQALKPEALQQFVEILSAK
ncbi:MAG TPA: FkbM family methyltransferase, partial [Burkholderiaceae bacterium]|nr:FkbM family methyltransferase [Burkholderiaceae bacterium]